MFCQCNPLSLAANIRHRVASDRGERNTAFRPPLRVGSNNDRRVSIDDDCSVRQRLRLRRINVATQNSLDKGFFIVRLARTKARDEFVIQNPP